MPENPVPESANLDENIKRIHHLGTNTSNLFSRLYQGLNQRAKLNEQQALLTASQQNNLQLRRTIADYEQELTQLQAILASIEDGIILQDLQGRIVMVNPAAETILGREQNFWQSELGSWFNEYQDIQQVESELVPMGRSETFKIGEQVLGAQIAAVADSTGQRFGTLIILRDMTRASLESRLKDGVIAGISHELKTPLAAMRVASELLLASPEDAPPNRKMLEMIARNIDVLNRMIIELLDVSEMTGGAFAVEKESVDLESLVWDVIQSFEPDIIKARLDIRLMLRDTERLYIDGDSARLKWAIGHLLRNAIAYNERNGHIVVMLYAGTNDDAGQIHLAVKDNGVGIAEADQSKIFDLFFRGEARTQSGRRIDPRGLGQGLFIVQQVAQAHDGQIALETTLHEGSTFKLAFPATQALPA
ncbi:MAG: ATP-binding protein [Aggregatilineales bacterium]